MIINELSGLENVRNLSKILFMESQYYSLLSDYGFKVVFADESNTLFLRKSLQALLKSEVEIKEVKFTRNELTALTKESRGGLCDLVCEDELGNSFIVEMQLGYYKNFMPRLQFYAFHRFNKLVEKGEYFFTNLSKIYCIGFLSKSIFPTSEQFYHYITLKNQVGEELNDQTTYIILEIDKFDKAESEIVTDLEKLIFIMKNLGKVIEEADLPSFHSEDWMKQALTKLDKSKMDHDQRLLFEMALARHGSMMEMLEEAEKKGEKKGVKKGEKKGVKKGDQKATIRFAKKLQAKGFDNATISELTGLNIEEIENL